MYLAAVIQLNCTSNEQANWESARSLIERAAGYGARFVATPENTNYLGPHGEKARRAEFEEVKRTLTTLLDVEPVGAPARDPIPLPRSVPEPPKQVG